MAKIAESKGIKVIEGIAESLPLESGTYDCVLMVTTICFLDDPMQSFKEIYRILTPGGFVIIGFMERNSAIGKLYEKNHQNSLFYKDATFFTTKKVTELLEKSGFVDIQSYQTLFGNTLENVETSIKEGSNGGAFIAIRAKKAKNKNFIYEHRKQQEYPH
ncbi:MAG: SAM-dependent methyltransferase [uncultured Sulfurovum sp.]|uniref:SAM-dependent methyltransferase n=1 Tax=uncultured Sulfurovum sp. TaxID=269237 RepID=A0A6S6SYM9_9BACT|nr:MAG: SAM-dependent methyltransferase [uncultured Sulfurovum sp.]